MTDKTAASVPVGSDGWPISDAYVFVIRPDDEWLPFAGIGDAVEFEREHATPSEPTDVIFVLSGDGHLS